MTIADKVEEIADKSSTIADKVEEIADKPPTIADKFPDITLIKDFYH
ncbi:hypothetical protein MWJ95_01225 [Lysinibacillus sp. Bpr_S20]|nr:hypothetical protein [Lysinibacillus sp. Bpr_S20]